MMRLRQLILASAFAVGLSSAASAAPLMTSASRTLLSPDAVVEFSKYPPAKPGALGDVPLEAADGSLTRPDSGLAT
jgi:hypothetical protein